MPQQRRMQEMRRETEESGYESQPRPRGLAEEREQSLRSREAEKRGFELREDIQKEEDENEAQEPREMDVPRETRESNLYESVRKKGFESRPRETRAGREKVETKESGTSRVRKNRR